MLEAPLRHAGQVAADARVRDDLESALWLPPQAPPVLMTLSYAGPLPAPPMPDLLTLGIVGERRRRNG